MYVQVEMDALCERMSSTLARFVEVTNRLIVFHNWK